MSFASLGKVLESLGLEDCVVLKYFYTGENNRQQEGQEQQKGQPGNLRLPLYQAASPTSLGSQKFSRVPSNQH